MLRSSRVRERLGLRKGFVQGRRGEGCRQRFGAPRARGATSGKKQRNRSIQWAPSSDRRGAFGGFVVGTRRDGLLQPRRRQRGHGRLRGGDRQGARALADDEGLVIARTNGISPHTTGTVEVLKLSSGSDLSGAKGFSRCVGGVCTNVQALLEMQYDQAKGKVFFQGVNKVFAKATFNANTFLCQ
jgi:hypothetical protein